MKNIYKRNNPHTLLKIAVMLFLALSASKPLNAAVRLPQLVSHKMVLQRDTELNIWGWANPGEMVTVRFNGKYYDTKTGNNGKWNVILPAQKAGGPYIMEINEIILRDILIGDVWLCSGQSNQESPIARLTDMYPEINVSNNHMIRHYKVPIQNTPGSIKDDILKGAQWHSGVASEVMNWTALAYFYALEAYEKTKVPQGMLVSSLGGSAIESWIDQNYLKEFPNVLVDNNALDSIKIVDKDKGGGLWCKVNYDDSNWSSMNMPGRWRNNGVNAKGVVWFRKDFEVPSSMDGKHAKLHMGMMIDSDSVFINGCFVGSTSYMYPPRKYDIPAGVLRSGKNNITVRLNDRNGNGGFEEDKPYKIVGDDVDIDLKGEWKYKIGYNINDVEILQSRLKNLSKAGSGLYNGMIIPIKDYKVKGVIWYQGETNTGDWRNYYKLLSSLIVNWRDLYNDKNMPFLLVQLPNFLRKQQYPGESGWAGLRDAQLNVAKTINNTALAITYDIGEWNDIHPLNKKDVAKLLFLVARIFIYIYHLFISGLFYIYIKVEGSQIIITFTATGSFLTSNGN